jgi:molybdopterin converting factor small subunit
MRIRVKLFTTLTSYLPKEARDFEFSMEVPAGSRAGQVSARIGIPQELVMIALVNGRTSELDRPLVEGDVLAFFRPIAGG